MVQVNLVQSRDHDYQNQNVVKVWKEEHDKVEEEIGVFLAEVLH